MSLDRDPQEQVNWQLASQVLQQMLGDQATNARTQEQQRMLALLQAQPEMALRLVDLAAIAEQQYQEQQQELQRRKSAEHQLLLQTQAFLEQQAAERLLGQSNLLRQVPGFNPWQQQQQQIGPNSNDSATVSDMAVNTGLMAQQNANNRQQTVRAAAAGSGSAADKDPDQCWEQPNTKRTKVSHQQDQPQLQQMLEGASGRKGSSGDKEVDNKPGPSPGSPPLAATSAPLNNATVTSELGTAGQVRVHRGPGRGDSMHLWQHQYAGIMATG